MEIKIIEGDLLDQGVEVIVNAWNRNIIPWWLRIPQGVSGLDNINNCHYTVIMDARERGMIAFCFSALVLLGQGVAFPGQIYPSADSAAVAFVATARGKQNQTKEYCAYIFKATAGFTIGLEAEGDHNHCPSVWPVPRGAVASVHTHPIGGGANDPGTAAQIFSDGDYNHAEAANKEVQGFTGYLGAPLGHIIRYRAGNTFCKGGSWIKHVFTIISGPNVMRSLPSRSGEWESLISLAGAKLDKPDYCRSEQQ